MMAGKKTVTHTLVPVRINIARRLASAAVLGTLIFAAVKNPLHGQQREWNPPLKLEQSMKIAEKDRKHEFPVGFKDFEVNPPASGIVVLTPKQCIKCHNAKTPPSMRAITQLITGEAQKSAKEIAATFPTRFNLSGTTIAISPHVLDKATGKPLFGATDAGIGEMAVKAGIAAQRMTMKYWAIHEVFHAVASGPEEGIKEPWAYAYPLIRNPSLVFKQEDKHRLFDHNGHTEAFLTRAAMTMKKAPLPTTKDGKVFSISEFANHQKTLTLRAVEETGKLYKNAFALYQSNSVYWDAIAIQCRNPIITVDWLIAQKMKDEGILDQVIGNKPLLARTQEVFDKIFGATRQEYSAILQINSPGIIDARNIFQASVKDNIPVGSKDVLYYAAIYEKLKNGPQKAAQPSLVKTVINARTKILQETAGILRGFLDKVLKQQNSPQKKAATKAYRERLAYAQAQLKQLEKQRARNANR